MKKFKNGQPEKFSITGFSDAITSIDSVSTDDGSKYIYLLDRILSRIVVLDKDGVYQSQYQWEELKNATDISASEEEGKIFVLIGSKIYTIDIK